MTAAELRAIRKTTDEFAVLLQPVQDPVPRHLVASIRRIGLRACPRGLRRVKLIEDGYAWEESFTLVCGDTEHTMTRRNGVLVEVPTPEDSVERTKLFRAARSKKVANVFLHTPDSGDEQVTVRLVISRQAVFAPWGEYAMIEAEREKLAEEQAQREERMDRALDALGIEKEGRSGGQWYGVGPWNHVDGYRQYAGVVSMSLEQAEELAKKLGER
jgi:hypothetical protein